MLRSALAEQLERLMKANLWSGKISDLALAMVMAAGLAASGKAQTVLVDFGNAGSFRGVTVPSPDANGHFWNSIAPGAFISDMRDINNNPTTIDLGFDTPVGTDSFNGPAGVTSFPNPTAAEIAATDIDTVALGNLGIKEAAIDFAASPGGADNRTRFQIQQLNPAKRYTLTLFGSHKFSDNDATVYSVFTDNTYSTLVASASLNVQTPGSPNLHNRDMVATLSNLSPQASNILYVQFVGSQGGLGYLNDFQITAIPEPGTLILLTGAVALVLRRRR
jgi:hypothetical protein